MVSSKEFNTQSLKKTRYFDQGGQLGTAVVTEDGWFTNANLS